MDRRPACSNHHTRACACLPWRGGGSDWDINHSARGLLLSDSAAEQGIKWGDAVAGDPRLGADYGSFCAAWEDGLCHPTASLPNPDGHHSCGTLSTCDALWSSYNFNDDHGWCCEAWCYVNASTCDGTAHGIDVARSWATTADIYYSYGACADTQYATYTEDTCPYRSTMPGCECSGDNSALGAVELAKHGADYGKW